MRCPTPRCRAGHAAAAATLLLSPLLLRPVAAQSPPPAAEASNDGPWRLGPALSLPDWLRVSGSTRLRYESLEGQFRAIPTRSDGDAYFVARTLLAVEADFLDRFTATLEGTDSRQEGADRGSTLNTGIVNSFDVLQGNLSADLGALGSGRHRATAGRFTMDRGSRRLIARNRFRNTINAFDGVQWDWRDGDGTGLNLFWTLPVFRRPFDRASLLDNEQEWDDQDSDNQFFGGFFTTPLCEDTQLELYTYGLDDSRLILREHFTPGFRVVREPQQVGLDYEIEAALQVGQSELPVLQPDRDLDHLAWFGHVSVGYTFDAPWRPRVQLAWDYASGDHDPNDDENNRFDTLFGARRWEYGPTGIYGAVFRSNLNSPELRVELRPAARWQLMTALRGIWLAESRDFWVPAALRDPTGAAGKHVGEQLEARLRYDILPKSVRLEVGGAYLFAGSFQEQAPGGRGKDTVYGYAQVAWTF